MKVAIYTRISEDKSGEGANVETQGEDCLDWCADNGHEVFKVYEDNDISATNGKHRPQYQEMLQGIADKSFEAVVTWHQDRITRNPWEMEEYILVCSDRKVSKTGIPTFTLNGGPLDLTTPEGRLQARFGVMIAQYYVEHNQTNNLRTMKKLRDKGEWHGGPPGYGWTQTGTHTIEPVPEAIPHIRKCYEMYLDGASFCAIAEYLNSAGQVTRFGNQFTDTAVRQILRSPTHAGLMEYMGDVRVNGHVPTYKVYGELSEGNWEGFIPRDVYMEARERLTDPTWSKRGRPRLTEGVLLNGIMVCGECGRNMSYHSSLSNPRYVCRCGKTAIQESKADSYVVPQVLAVLRESRSAHLVARKQAEIKRIDAKLVETSDAFMAGDIGRSEKSYISRELRDQRSRAEQTIRVAGISPDSGTPQWWDGLTCTEKRNTIKGSVTITLHRARGAAKNVENRIAVEPVK